MLKIINPDSNAPQIVATEGYLHRKGDSTYSEMRKCFLLPGQTIDDFEELAELPNEAATAAYNERVNELIRQRYSLSQELAILRQRDTKPDEFATYNAVCEAAKAQAKAETES